MAAYYYLAASLPTLSADGRAPFSSEEFLDSIQGFVSKGDFRVIKQLAEGGDVKGNRVCEKFLRFKRLVSEEMAEQRARKLGVSPEKYMKDRIDREAGVSDAVRAAIAAENPLEGENAIFRLYWKYLDELSVNHIFDMDALSAYALKLSLLQRKNRFMETEGKAEFERLFSSLQSGIKNS